MKRLLRIILGFSKLLNMVAVIALAFMVLITVVDVILRYFRKPVPGTYELVAFSGLAVIGFSLPLTQWMKGHISVELLVEKFPVRVRNITDVSTRLIGICFFLLSGLYLMKMGFKLYVTGSVSLTLQMPYYPLAYGVGFCFFIQCFVLLAEIVKILGGIHE